MNLSNPLETLMRPPVANALLVLARLGDRLTGRQVARITGSASASGTRDALLQLVDIGLVVSEPTPNATYYSVNRNHLLWPAVESIMDARERFDSGVEAFCRSSAPEGTAVALYGSTATGRSTSSSDVDVLVVYPDTVTAADRDEFSDSLATRIRSSTGNRAEVFDVTHAQLHEMIATADPMVSSWRADARPLFGALPDFGVAA